MDSHTSIPSMRRYMEVKRPVGPNFKSRMPFSFTVPPITSDGLPSCRFCSHHASYSVGADWARPVRTRGSPILGSTKAQTSRTYPVPLIGDVVTFLFCNVSNFFSLVQLREERFLPTYIIKVFRIEVNFFLQDEKKPPE